MGACVGKTFDENKDGQVTADEVAEVVQRELKAFAGVLQQGASMADKAASLAPIIVHIHNAAPPGVQPLEASAQPAAVPLPAVGA